MQLPIKVFWIIPLFTVSFLSPSAQEIPVITQQQVEDLADATETETIEDDSYLQSLEYYRKHPAGINSATPEELQLLRILTDLQIQNLVQYRRLAGPLINLYELQAVPAWDVITIKKLLPYVTLNQTVSGTKDLLSRFRGGEQSILLRASRVLEAARGYDTAVTNHYLGDRNHLLLRYRYQYRNLLQYGLTADKDAGEPFFKGAQAKGFDFYSAHLFIRSWGKIKALAVGDYTVNLGQGLIQWQSLAFGKSGDVMAVKRSLPVLAPYRAAGEFNFSRGAGLTVQYHKLEATAFVSHKKISGNIITDTMDVFSGFLTSGYYRNATELADRNKISYTSFGGNLSYHKEALKIGLNAVANSFSLPLQKKEEPYNYFAAAGRSSFNTSIDYSYTYRNIHLFGEAAADGGFHRAVVSGALISADPKVDISVLYRSIQKEYVSLFGNAFTENILPANETGFYTGIALRPLAGWQFSAYVDVYTFPWLRYRAAAPGRGFDYMTQAFYKPAKQTEIYLRYHTKSKPLNSSNNVTMAYPDTVLRQSLRFHVSSQVNPRLALRSRIEVSWYNRRQADSEEGFLAFMEGQYMVNKALDGNLRLQYFETGGYNSRIYAYESDVLYSFSAPAFFDKGFRYYLNLNYQWKKSWQFWLRWAQTIYKGKEKTGSGLDEISGNKKSEIRLQIQFILK